MTTPGKKPEGWLGVTLTAILCLGFLYWWFRPRPEETTGWRHHAPEELVDLALREPPSPREAERLLLDFDLMELAVLQARLGMAPEGLEVAKRVKDPVVQAHAVRQAALGFLNSDPDRLDQALTMCDVIADPARRAATREEILLQIAMLGFADVVTPQAEGVTTRARLARTLLASDNRRAGRELLREVEAQMDALPEPEAAEVRREVARGRVWLTLEEGPAQAFPAIRRLDAAERREFWLDLLQVCLGRGETARREAELVVAEVAEDAALRREMELEALRASQPLRPVEELQAEWRSVAEGAAPGEEKILALLTLAAVYQYGETPDASLPVLREAKALAAALPDPKSRAALLAECGAGLSEALLLEEAEASFQAAAEAARAVSGPERLAALAATMAAAFENGQDEIGFSLADEAVALCARERAADRKTAETLAEFLTHAGEWASVLKVRESLPEEADRAAVLEKMAKVAAEDAMVYETGSPPRGPALDEIREKSTTNEIEAAALVKEQPEGLPRARAWLAMAKGQLLPPPGGVDALSNPWEGGLDGGLLPGEETGDEEAAPGGDGAADAPPGGELLPGPAPAGGER